MRSFLPWRMRSRNGWHARAGRSSGRKARLDDDPGAEARWRGMPRRSALARRAHRACHKGEDAMPKVKANQITINYEQQGTGEPLLLIPYLAADNACYAFQVADYAKEFTCISIDPRGAGDSDKPSGTYSTELF